MNKKIAWNKGIDSRNIVICKQCNKKFKTYNKNRKYCCRKCYLNGREYIFTKEHKNKISLKLKGNKNGRFSKGFKRSKENKKQISKSLKKYYKEHPEAIENLRLKRQNQKNVYISKPELIFKKILEKNNIEFIHQKYISNIEHSYRCDFFIYPNLIIEVDGDYWHSLPKNKIKDMKRNVELKKAGYKLIRIKTSEICNVNNYKLNNKNIIKYIKKIKNEIK